MDSDDYFAKNKVKLVVKKFTEQIKIKTLFDIPIIKTNKNLIKQKFAQKNFILVVGPDLHHKAVLRSREVMQIKYPKL